MCGLTDEFYQTWLEVSNAASRKLSSIETSY
jgi:hypothetical protein